MRRRQIACPHARGERRSGDKVWSGPILIFELHDAHADRGPGHSAPLRRGRYRRTREARPDGTGCTAKRNGAHVGMGIPRSGKGGLIRRTDAASIRACARIASVRILRGRPSLPQARVRPARDAWPRVDRRAASVAHAVLGTRCLTLQSLETSESGPSALSWSNAHGPSTVL